MTSPDFRRLFESAPSSYVVLTADLEIVAANDAYLRATMTRREDIVGRRLFDVFPLNPEGPPSTVEADMRASISRVIATGRRDALPVVEYDVRPAGAGGRYEERHWSPVNLPVFDDDGRVALILHAVEDVTEQVRSQQHVREMSTPVVSVRTGILLLPVVGTVDAPRAELLMETVLGRATEENARVVIIDVAGVPVVDTSVADLLIKTALSLRLLGAQTVLTGIGASTARTIVGLGIDLSILHTCGRLSEGIELAVELVERRGNTATP